MLAIKSKSMGWVTRIRHSVFELCMMGVTDSMIKHFLLFSAVSEYTLDVGDGELNVNQLSMTGVSSMNVEQSDMILEVLVIHVYLCVCGLVLW